MVEEKAKKANDLVYKTQSAMVDAIAADAELLDELIELIRPSLRPIAGPIRIGYDEWWDDGTCPQERYIHSQDRGIRVAGTRSTSGPGLCYDGQCGGHYEGRDLYISTSGALIEIAYTGTFSTEQGGVSGWRCKEEEIPAVDAVERYGLNALVSAVSSALSRYIDKCRDSPETYRRRARKVRAVCVLLED